MANYPGGRSRAAEVMVGITDALRDFITRYALGFKTQSTFANAVGGGVTPQRWNNYESGRDRLTLNLALVVRRVFPQLTLDWLFCGDKGTLRPAFSAALDEAERFVRR